jgi:F-type H+-transporting ATPase subunit epsilon
VQHVEVVAPDREVFSGEAEIVIARTLEEGDIGVLGGHAPLLGVLVPYPVVIRGTSEGDLVYAVNGGFLSVSQDGVKVLGDEIVAVADIDRGEAQAELDAAKVTGAEHHPAAEAWAAAKIKALEV